jgi:nicotinamide riboside transporter PnuC
MLTLSGELRKPSLVSTVPYFIITFQVSLLTKMLMDFLFYFIISPLHGP